MAHECPNVEVWATDTSRSAVQLARANVRRHRLEDRVFVHQCDLLDEVPAPVDLIVANLPYVPESTAAEHPDLLVEPFESVFAPGDGLGPYRRLVHAAADWLADDGELLLQLHRQVFAATRSELPDFSAALDASSSERELSALWPPISDAAARPRPRRSRTSDSARAVRGRRFRSRTASRRAPSSAAARRRGLATLAFCIVGLRSMSRLIRPPPPERHWAAGPTFSGFGSGRNGVGHR
ncbi:MAG: methyltransferase [Gaiellaceae bacterium]